MRSRIWLSFTPSAQRRSRVRSRGQLGELRAEMEDQEQPETSRSFRPDTQTTPALHCLRKHTDPTTGTHCPNFNQSELTGNKTRGTECGRLIGGTECGNF